MIINIASDYKRGVNVVNQFKKIDKLGDNTTFTRDELKKYYSKTDIDNLIKNKDIKKMEYGIYAKADQLIDPFSIYHLKYQRGVYCLNTALYLWGYSDRYPETLDMMFPQGYNTSNIVNAIRPHTQIDKYFKLGVKKLKTDNGNIVKVYSLERTLAEILRPKNHFDIELVTKAYKKWAKSPNKDINSVIMFAEQFKVLDKLQTYMEVLL